MPLSTGTRLGPYEILAPIGAGGMGEVYRAADSRLRRDVALKVLPAALERDTDRMGRFQREAQNAHKLFYRSADGHIMAATYAAKGDSFVADKPRVWSERRIPLTPFFSNFDLAPDGKRLVVIMDKEAAGEQKPSTQMIFLLNFFDELRRRVPVR